jgi:hypothetical protein
MITLSYYFLGLATFILAATVCLAKGRRASHVAEVEIENLRTLSVCLPMPRQPAAEDAAAIMYKGLSWEEKAKWSHTKAMWLQWYTRLQEEAILRQKAIYSWARTLSLCALLCLVGVLLEAEFDQPITIRTVLAGFRRQEPVACSSQTLQVRPSASPSTSAAGSSRQK